MTGSTQQIVTAYEDNNMSVEQIIEAFDNEFDAVAIHAVLSQFSGKYRNDNASKSKSDEVKTPGFTEDDEELALRTIRSLAEYAEDENLRGRMAMFMREDRRGRRDAVSKLGQGAGGNIYLLQQFIAKGNEALKLAESKVIDVSVQRAAQATK